MRKEWNSSKCCYDESSKSQIRVFCKHFLKNVSHRNAMKLKQGKKKERTFTRFHTNVLNNFLCRLFASSAYTRQLSFASKKQHIHKSGNLFSTYVLLCAIHPSVTYLSGEMVVLRFFAPFLLFRNTKHFESFIADRQRK